MHSTAKIRIFLKLRKNSVVGFLFQYYVLCLKTKNLAFNKNHYNKFVFTLDSKYSKQNSLLKWLKTILHLKWRLS